MARISKLEVSAVNLRIPQDKERDYPALIQSLVAQRAAAKVHGETFVAITRYDPETGFGTISKYSEIDVDGDWFDIESFETADPSEVEKVTIPEKLRPNLSTFDFYLDSKMHILIFETYSVSKTLSAGSFNKYLTNVLSRAEVKSEFGKVECDIVKNIEEVDRILKLETLKELTILIKRPNPDGIPPDLASEIEEALVEQNAEELERRLKSKDSDGLKPNDRTRNLAFIAVDNGEVEAKALENGVLVRHSTKEKPFIETETYSRDEEVTSVIFRRLVDRVQVKIKQLREKLGGTHNIA